MNELKVTFYLKKNETRADGIAPVLGRIRIGKSMVQFSAKVYIQEKLWDVKSGRAKGKSKAALNANAELDKLCVAIHSAYKDLQLKSDNVLAIDVKTLFKESHPSRTRWSSITSISTRNSTRKWVSTVPLTPINGIAWH